MKSYEIAEKSQNPRGSGPCYTTQTFILQEPLPNADK